MGKVKKEKDGLTYIYSPVWFLNDDKDKKGLGDKLNDLFKEHNIDVDLECGTGGAMNNIYYTFDDDRYGKYAGFNRLFEYTDYREEKEFTHNTTNQVANQNLRESIGTDLVTSKLYYKFMNEKYPRKIFLNNEGKFEISKPINELNVQDYKPKEPNVFKKFFHWMNENWFNDDFNKYYRDNRAYENFSRDFEKIKEDSEKITAEKEKKDYKYTKENSLVKEEQLIKDRKTVFNERINQILGPNPSKNEILFKKKVFNADYVLPEKLEYPKNIPFSDNDIAMIGYIAMSDPSISKAFNKNKYFTDTQNVERLYVHVTHDIFYKDNERQKSGETYAPIFAAARLKAKECIEQYAQGNKEPLAKLIGNAVKFQLMQENGFQNYTGLTVATTNVTTKMFGLLDKDPELLKNSGLTKEDLFSLKSHQKMAELFTKGAKAEVLLQRAGKGEVLLTQQEKEEALLSVFSSRLAVKWEQMDFHNCEEKNAEKIMETTTDYSEKLGEISKVKLKMKEISANDPRRSELENELKDVENQSDAIHARISELTTHRKDSPIMKLLGSDDMKHPNLSELQNKIMGSKTFKEWADKLTSDIRKAQTGLDGSVLLDDEVTKVMTELTENQAKLDNGEKLEVNQVEKTEVKNINPQNDQQKLDDVQIKPVNMENVKMENAAPQLGAL